MKNERILVVDDRHADTTCDAIKIFGKKDGHEVVGVARSMDEVKTFVDSGLEITLALVDNRFPKIGDGETAANIIKEKFPGVIIITLSADHGVNFGKLNLVKGEISAAELVNAITNIQH